MKKKTIKAKLAKTEKKLAKAKSKLSAAESALKAAKKDKPITAKAGVRSEPKKPAVKKPAAKKPAPKKPPAKKKAPRRTSPFVKPVAISLEELLPESNGMPTEIEAIDHGPPPSESAPQHPIEAETEEPSSEDNNGQSAAA